MSNTAGHDNHKKIDLWVSFSFLYGYGAQFGGLSGCWSSAMNDQNKLLWPIKAPKGIYKQGGNLTGSVSKYEKV